MKKFIVKWAEIRKQEIYADNSYDAQKEIEDTLEIELKDDKSFIEHEILEICDHGKLNHP